MYAGLSPPAMYPITLFMTKDFPALVVSPAREQSGKGKISGQVAGGGKTILQKNVVYILSLPEFHHSVYFN
jgi:hypothetical protein